jgi:hypothetical protein
MTYIDAKTQIVVVLPRQQVNVKEKIFWQIPKYQFDKSDLKYSYGMKASGCDIAPFSYLDKNA